MIDFTKPVQTRDGRKVRILCTDAPRNYTVVGYWIDSQGNANVVAWDAQGHFLHNGPEHLNDLIQVPEHRVRWINVYANELTSRMYETKDEADSWGTSNRLACIKIEFDVPGEGA